MNKTERTELRGVVRNQFRVLRKEVDQRTAELIAQGEQQILDHFHEADVARADIDEQVDAILRAAIDKIREVCKDRPDAGVPKRLTFGGAAVQWAPDRRGELRAALYTKLSAASDGAKLTLERQEADLLRNLAVGALESAEAHAFLGSITNRRRARPGCQTRGARGAVPRRRRGERRRWMTRHDGSMSCSGSTPTTR